MKKIILATINRLLKPLDAKVVRKSSNALGMVDVLERLARRDVAFQTIIDIGASDGNWSVACMEHFPSASYLAIEPLKERQEALDATKRSFSNFDYALCVAGACGETEAYLNVAPDLDGTTVEKVNSESSRICPVRTIDSLAQERDLPGPYLLKFDTHGYELPILSGCNDVLTNTSAIIMEVYNFQLTPTSLRFHDMCAHLELLGFRPADIAEPMLRLHDQAFWQVDILFLKSESEIFKYSHYS